MPWPVYSTRFVVAAAAGMATYAVPAGKRAVVKCVTGTNSTAAPEQVGLYIGGALLWLAPIQANASTVAGNLMVVANAGELVQLRLWVGGLTASAHGFLLDAPPTAATKPIEPERPVVTPL